MFMFHSGSRSWKSEIRVQAAWILVRAVFQACLQTTASRLVWSHGFFLITAEKQRRKREGRMQGERERGKEGARAFSSFILEYD